MAWRELLDVPSKLKALGVRAFSGDMEVALPGYRVIMLMGMGNADGDETELTIVVDRKSSAFLDGNISDELMGEVRSFGLSIFFGQIEPSKWLDAEGTPFKRKPLNGSARRRAARG